MLTTDFDSVYKRYLASDNLSISAADAGGEPKLMSSIGIYGALKSIPQSYKNTILLLIFYMMLVQHNIYCYFTKVYLL